MNLPPEAPVSNCFRSIPTVHRRCISPDKHSTWSSEAAGGLGRRIVSQCVGWRFQVSKFGLKHADRANEDVGNFQN